MNYRHLVESGKYSKENLSEAHRAYIEGMEHARSILDNFVSLEILDLDLEENSILDKIRMEEAEQTIEDLKDFLYAETCEAIVALADGYEMPWRQGGEDAPCTGN